MSYIKPYSVKLIFAWYDIWIGLFIDKNKKLLYFFPIPMLGLRFKYGYLKYESKQTPKADDGPIDEMYHIK